MWGDIIRSGITFYQAIPEQNPSLIYGEGLRVPQTLASGELDNLKSTATFGKKKGFERVILDIRFNKK
jgi:hypothetical protein